MHEGVVSPGAVEPPAPRIEPLLGRRRHRRITGMSGAVLFACLFLPAVRGCSEPVYPFDAPIFPHPYLFGLVFAIAAGTLTARGLRVSIVLLRVLSVLAVVGGALAAIAVPLVGLLETVVGFMLLGAIGTRGYSERRAAVTAVVIASCSILWFGFWCLSSDALVGAYASLVGSCGLLAGGLVWLGELGSRWEAPIAAASTVARSAR